MRETGRYEKMGHLDHFIPDPLPPQNPSFHMDFSLIDLYGQAMHRLGQLNEMTKRVPNIQRFIKAYVVKEALLSSEIEGIHTTLIDVLSESITDFQPNKDTQLVLNYTKSLEKGLEMIVDQGIPLVSRVLLATHKVLMEGGEGKKSSPGAYRQQSVRVGNLIPPSAPHIPHLIKDLEIFMNEEGEILPLIKAGLAHVQFETIHPFLDGNGRIGRLLIVLMLIKDGLLAEPIFYPSYAFKKYHAEYYAALDKVRIKGDFEGWIHFYLQCIVESAQDAWQRAKSIEALEQSLREQILNAPQFSKTREDSLRFLSILFQYPVIGIPQVAHHLQRSFNTAVTHIKKFEESGFLRLSSEQQRNKVYVFQSYLDVLERDQ